MLRKTIAPMLILVLAGCRGESVPRDYQNAPPGATHAADDTAGAPPPQAMNNNPEPSSGAEGTLAPYTPVDNQGAATTSTAGATRIPENAVTTTNKMSMPSPNPTP